MSLAPLSPTPRSTVRRGAKRARTDRDDLCAVLDAGHVCHLGVLLGGAPVVLPTAYGRVDDVLYLHGSTGAASIRAAATGSPVSVAVTLVDGVVHARSVFHFSMNYRSAVVHGTARLVTDPDERLAGLRAVTEQIAPGAWEYARQPSRKELAATAVLALDLTEASVKVRTGPPVDDEDDVRDSPEVWAGVVPLRTTAGAPQACPSVPPGIDAPQHARILTY